MIKEPEGASPSLISDHPYAPRREDRADWDLCLVCGLGIATHARRASPEEEAALHEETLRGPAYVVERYGAIHSWTLVRTTPRLSLTATMAAAMLRWWQR